ncbi:hypothetical protein T484DRAFT_2490886 [Baffinella frigidus]|nr:hypothetical protein T484DRAFT_2490886 [Cryptophyta sp. CCMP2293]
MRNLCFICTLLVTLGATAISAFSVPAARAALRLSLGGAASCPAEKRLGAVPPRARSQAARLAMNWADPDWSWGYGVGKAHDSASVLRSALSSEESRTKWIQALLVDEKLEWEVVKLCLALQWQRAAREGRDGGTGGFGDILERLVDCKYEGSDDTDDLLYMEAGRGTILNLEWLNLVPVTGRLGHVSAGYPADR